MNVFQMRDKLKARLIHLNVDFKFDREEETLRIYRTDNHKGVTIKLNAIVAKYEEQKDKIIDEIVYYVEEADEITQTARIPIVVPKEKSYEKVYYDNQPEEEIEEDKVPKENTMCPIFLFLLRCPIQARGEKRWPKQKKRYF